MDYPEKWQQVTFRMVNSGWFARYCEIHLWCQDGDIEAFAQMKNRVEYVRALELVPGEYTAADLYIE
jgi:hypothetical protein